MFIKLLTYAGLWIGFGFASGSLIWLGMVLSQRRGRARLERTPLESQHPEPRLGSDGGSTYRVLEGGMKSGRKPASKKPHRLLNFPR